MENSTVDLSLLTNCKRLWNGRVLSAQQNCFESRILGCPLLVKNETSNNDETGFFNGSFIISTDAESSLYKFLLQKS